MKSKKISNRWLYIPILILGINFIIRIINQSKIIKQFPLDTVNDVSAYIAELHFLNICGFHNFCGYWYNGFTNFQLSTPGWHFFTYPIYLVFNDYLKAIYISIILIFLLSCKIMFATIIHVPDDVETIQGGLNLSESGDTVLVAPGTYVENIIWPPDKDSIKLIGSGQDNSIIDGDQNGIVILMAAFEGVDSIEDSEISNFTIQNGFTAGSGGGIVISSANVTLKNLTIKGNSGNYGGGLNTLHSFVNLRNSYLLNKHLLVIFVSKH